MALTSKASRPQKQLILLYQSSSQQNEHNYNTKTSSTTYKPYWESYENRLIDDRWLETCIEY